METLKAIMNLLITVKKEVGLQVLGFSPKKEATEVNASCWMVLFLSVIFVFFLFIVNDFLFFIF